MSFFVSDTALCKIAVALNPAGKGVSGWDCSAGIPSAAGVCTWGGITCSKNNVISVNLSGLGLSGSIPASIGDITTIQSLILSNNNIIGTIPSSITNLIGLTNINISGNKLSGVIPTALCQVTSHSLGSYTTCGNYIIRTLRFMS